MTDVPVSQNDEQALVQQELQHKPKEVALDIPDFWTRYQGRAIAEMYVARVTLSVIAKRMGVSQGDINTFIEANPELKRLKTHNMASLSLHVRNKYVNQQKADEVNMRREREQEAAQVAARHVRPRKVLPT